MKTPILIINFKNYLEASGQKVIELSQDSQKVSQDLGVEIVIAPPTPYLALVAKSVSIPVISQHIDPAIPGGSTGENVAEIIKNSGVVGSLVNHSEKRISQSSIEFVVKNLHTLNMSSVVCARTPSEVYHLSKIHSELVAIEPPELIGSGIAVSKANPDIVIDSVSAAKKADSKARVICGAGIVDGDDVKSSIKLGAVGVLVASGIVKAKNRLEKIKELAESLI